MSTIAQSRDLSDRKTIEDFAAVVQNLERLKMLTILTTADIRAVGPGVWNGWKAQLLRTLYYETEPVLTGGFSEVNRSRRVEMAQAEFRAAMGNGNVQELDRYILRHYPPYWLKVDLARKLEHARFIREAEAAGKIVATSVRTEPARASPSLRCSRPIIRRLLSIIAGACAAAAATSLTPRLTRRPTATRSIRYRSRASSISTKTKSAARSALRTASRRRCAARCVCRKSSQGASRARA